MIQNFRSKEGKKKQISSHPIDANSNVVEFHQNQPLDLLQITRMAHSPLKFLVPDWESRQTIMLVRSRGVNGQEHVKVPKNLAALETWMLRLLRPSLFLISITISSHICQRLKKKLNYFLFSVYAESFGQLCPHSLSRFVEDLTANSNIRKKTTRGKRSSTNFVGINSPVQTIFSIEFLLIRRFLNSRLNYLTLSVFPSRPGPYFIQAPSYGQEKSLPIVKNRQNWVSKLTPHATKK